jgi:sodium/potassium-transporting ATPase subunit alpha
MIGSIADLTSGAKQKPTTLQLEIRKFVILIAILAISTVVICFIVWGAWLFKTYPSYINVSVMLVNAIAILVAFIPTGLPVSVTLSLLLVARKMARNRVLVKNLTTVETLSCVTVIASDKTGTLTQNKMYVTNASAGLKVLNSVLARRASVQIDPIYKIKSTLQLLSICILCNEAKFDENDKDKPINERHTSGGATDGAILKYAAGIIEMEQIENEFTEISHVPFNRYFIFKYNNNNNHLIVVIIIRKINKSRNKWMAMVFKENFTDTKLHDEEDYLNLDCFGLHEHECIISIKGTIKVDHLLFIHCLKLIYFKYLHSQTVGAPDILIKKCQWVLQDDGSQIPLDEYQIEKLNSLQIEWCKLGQRVLLICKKLDTIYNVMD